MVNNFCSFCTAPGAVGGKLYLGVYTLRGDDGSQFFSFYPEQGPRGRQGIGSGQEIHIE